MTRYIGNGAYCYANSAAMLLAAHGETVSPGLLEVLSGVGLGASLQQGSTVPFFSNLKAAPDIGITRALELLGFAFVERAEAEAAEMPVDALREMLAAGPAMLGPVDMGYLLYIPFHMHAAGADHYVLARAIEGDHVLLHDPAGFPYVWLTLSQLAPAWRGESIPYRRGTYRMWAAPRRERHPGEDELWAGACEWYAQCYRESDAIVAGQRLGAWLGGADAIRALAAHVSAGDVSAETRGHLINFALPLGARRADDFAHYVGRYDGQLSGLKHTQAALFGHCHVQATHNDWSALAATLGELAEIEDEIRAAVLDRATSEVVPG